MGRRSRKRADGPLSAPANPAPPKPRPESTGRMGRMDRMIARADERPKPPWHPFPLVELSVLIGIVMIVYGFIAADSPRGRVALVVGMALCSLAGLDTAVREHFEGYRSHTLLLSGLFAVVTAAALFFAKAPWIAIAITAVLVFAAGFAVFRRAFRRRAGVSFKT